MTEQSVLISKLKQGDESTIKTVYELYRSGFVTYALKYGVAADDGIDIYQDAVVALCENAKKGQLDTLKSELKTYLFAIGKYMMYAFLKKKNNTIAFEAVEDYEHDIAWEAVDATNENTLLLKTKFEQLGNQCKQILRLFYYEEKKLHEIVALMGYENKDVAKSQKSRCIKQLKTLVNK